MYIPPLFSALRQSFAEGYTLNALRGDISAGLTVGIIAIPLAMALAIAVGVPPQHGLYTVLIGGSIIALTGGSRFNVSGPTAAFVVILLPITQQFGVGGLLLCTAMAGVILISMGVLRAGALLQFIPYPVTLGFTAGIGVVIATLQVKDAFGLTNIEPTANYVEQIGALAQALPSIQLGDTLVAAITLLVLIIWPRFVPKIPGHLVALAVGSFVGLALNSADFSVATIGERFSYTVDGISHPGIPPFLPSFMWPWEFSGPNGQPLVLSFELFRQLLAPAFAIAMLGAIESLLCAVVSDGMAGTTKHDPNGELLGQGIGNILAPMFGGITATAAIARSAANVRAGAFSPIAAIIHAGVVLLAMLFLAPMFSHLPMAALAALLLMVAWNMSEPKHVIHTLRISPRNDVLVLLTCLSLTVLFDMVLAVGVGLLLAAGLFIKSMSDLTDTASVSSEEHDIPDLPNSVTVYAIRGPLFFGAAEKALSVLRKFNPEIRVVIIDLRAVPMLDMTALAALSSVLNDYQKNDIGIIFLGASAKVRHKMRRAGIGLAHSKLSYVSNFSMAQNRAQHWLDIDAGIEPNDIDNTDSATDETTLKQ